jgi:hypothetical protein
MQWRGKRSLLIGRIADSPERSVESQAKIRCLCRLGPEFEGYEAARSGRT